MSLPLENMPEIPSLKALLVTIHPSYLLRIEDEADKQAQYRKFVGDLRWGAKALAVRVH